MQVHHHHHHRRKLYSVAICMWETTKRPLLLLLVNELYRKSDKKFQFIYWSGEQFIETCPLYEIEYRRYPINILNSFYSPNTPAHSSFESFIICKSFYNVHFITQSPNNFPIIWPIHPQYLCRTVNYSTNKYSHHHPTSQYDFKRGRGTGRRQWKRAPQKQSY